MCPPIVSPAPFPEQWGQCARSKACAKHWPRQRAEGNRRSSHTGPPDTESRARGANTESVPGWRGKCGVSVGRPQMSRPVAVARAETAEEPHGQYRTEREVARRKRLQV